jgi:hypothetical protein
LGGLFIHPFVAHSAIYYECDYQQGGPSLPAAATCIDGFHVVEKHFYEDQNAGNFTCARDNSNWDPFNPFSDQDACAPSNAWLRPFPRLLYRGEDFPLFGLQACARKMETNAHINDLAPTQAAP